MDILPQWVKDMAHDDTIEPEAMARVGEIRDYMLGKGITRGQADAMLANIAVETGNTFDWQEKQKGSRNDPAYGLFQYDPRGLGLGKPYQAFLSSEGVQDSQKAQLDFMIDSLQGTYKPGNTWMGGGNAKKFLAVTDPAQGVEVFMDKVLNPGVPHTERRKAALLNIQPPKPQGVNAQFQVPLPPHLEQMLTQVMQKKPSAPQPTPPLRAQPPLQEVTPQGQRMGGTTLNMGFDPNNIPKGLDLKGLLSHATDNNQQAVTGGLADQIRKQSLLY